ncbi:Fis family transcriptional regulator [Burkholderia stabilis]|uniref:sigma-54 interaction domain-containing protein n=1 Tax=Burkholderia stabilis TaxID=95485 RepID=UPI000851E763|nr:sigma-54 dependent transcriptional regulator [Burkholderia stabilis]AOR71741.1 Fis family transcriptional regulator [Burkholderia stabilis]HDR9491719.1 sigma-54-dependent Fis family transcriptional regulator [Burkholderia stabilis]HDR9527674.1 sigma-54-dependent Fis family transcriptional regulator [Burkholderia stabilis]HDR9534788.1 sigma-54-dependent Fis family transcriptional regulator [Burkholderia stabilis]HDR9539170.1 sigma-54-dependent Fis family transcriptional regulator [Burkholder
MAIFSLPDPTSHAITIRAKALTFDDPKSRVLLERIQLVAPSDATVLVTGESGTGKELIARLVHSLSERHDGPFVAVNCGAFSETLIESELFGHERGAFTGAINSQPGWFESANRGTLFLDEVGDLPMSAQVKLLRVLQEREVTPVGSRKTVKIDVRLVAATNVNLEAAVRAGNFREDLYYRLNVVKLSLLPLRERPGDIAPLIEHFIDTYAKRLRVAAPALTDAARARLHTHAWPGNIRELENVIHHAVLICAGGAIDVGDLQFSALSLAPDTASAHVVAAPPRRARDVAEATDALRNAVIELLDLGTPALWQHIEDTVYRSVFDYSEHNQLRMSRLLDQSRNIVRARLAQLGILKPRDAGDADARLRRQA